jgi:hypothetical protein
MGRGRVLGRDEARAKRSDQTGCNRRAWRADEEGAGV